MILTLYLIAKVIFNQNNLQNSDQIQVKSDYSILRCKTNVNSNQLVNYMGRSKIKKITPHST